MVFAFQKKKMKIGPAAAAQSPRRLVWYLVGIFFVFHGHCVNGVVGFRRRLPRLCGASVQKSIPPELPVLNVR